MSPVPVLSKPGSRSALVAGLLLVTLVLTGILAYQAFDAGRSHEEVARKTVKEQAFFAAWEYAEVGRRILDTKVLKPGLDAVGKAKGKYPDEPFDPDRLTAAAKETDWHYRDHVRLYFRLHLADGRVELAEGRVELASGEDEALAAWIAAELPAHLDTVYGEGWAPVMLFPPGRAEALVYRTYPEGRREAEVAYGFLIEQEALTAPLAYAFDEFPLLPEALTGAAPNADLFTVTVHRPDRGVVFASTPSYTSDYVAKDSLGLAYGGLTASVTVRPEAVKALVIGGFPRSRLPLILGLMALAATLVLVAMQQLRRESELSQIRADFVSGVSHELRTPLAQIRMFAETLMLGRVRNDEERRRSLEIIVNESRRLTHQIDNVLLFSRAERNAVRLDVADTDLGVLVSEVLEAFGPLADAAGGVLEAHVAEGLVARVDGSSLRQALLNLLDNAVKYGPRGQTVQVGVSRLPGQRALLWVEDQGPGVPPDRRSRVWDAYFRLEGHRESAVAGSGIGLAVVRQIAVQHGGSARVEEGAGGGARFVMEIPGVVDAVEPPGRVAEAEPPGDAEPRPARTRAGERAAVLRSEAHPLRPATE